LHGIAQTFERPMELRSLVLSVSAVVLLVRILFFDALWILPRIPINYVFAFATPRFFEIQFPELYPFVGPFFDGDMTPHVWIATFLGLFVSGGLDWSFLWPREGRRWRKFCTLILSQSLLCWATAKFLEMHIVPINLSRFKESFPGTSRVSDMLGEPYDEFLKRHLLNFDGGNASLVPDETHLFKRLQETTDENQCMQERWIFGLPGDNYFFLNRKDVREGILRLDVFRPRKARFPKAPVIIFIHGGGWRKGDRAFLRINYHGGWPHKLVNNGYMIVSASYRLTCMTNDPQEMFEDVRDAVSFVHEQADSWGGDSSNIFLVGTSAGGHLVTLTGYKHRFEFLKGIISLYGVPELRRGGLLNSTTSVFEMLHTMAFTEATRFVCAKRPAHQTEDECFHEFSPVNHVNTQSPPTLLVHGIEDPLVLSRQSHALAKALSESSVQHALVEVPGSHDCDVHVSSACGQMASIAIEHFIETLTVKNN